MLQTQGLRCKPALFCHLGGNPSQGQKAQSGPHPSSEAGSLGSFPENMLDEVQLGNLPVKLALSQEL